MDEAKRYVVRGRVQGVGFRWFVQQSATTLRLRGWTRNLDNGDVEVYAIGSANQLNEFAGMLWKGPLSSDVRGVDVSEAAIEKLSTFRIVH